MPPFNSINPQLTPISFLRSHGLSIRKRRRVLVWTVLDGDGNSTGIYWDWLWGWCAVDSWGMMMLEFWYQNLKNKGRANDYFPFHSLGGSRIDNPLY